MRWSNLSALTALAFATAVARAQHVDYSWSVVQGGTMLLPGESVTLGLFAAFTVAGEPTVHDAYASGGFGVVIDGFGTDDALATRLDGTFGTEGREVAADGAYLGRRLNFQNFPASGELIYQLDVDPKTAVARIEGSGYVGEGSIAHWQPCACLIGGAGITDNPVEFFRLRFTAGTRPGSRIFLTDFLLAGVYRGPDSDFQEASFTNASIEITVLCPADLTRDGVVDVQDFFAFVALFAGGDPIADINGDGEIDIRDFFAFVAAFQSPCA